MLGRRGMHLVVEVVEHARHAPGIHVLAIAGGVGAHGRLDGQGVLAEVVRLGEFCEERPRGGAVQHIRV